MLSDYNALKICLWHNFEMAEFTLYTLSAHDKECIKKQIKFRGQKGYVNCYVILTKTENIQKA